MAQPRKKRAGNRSTTPRLLGAGVALVATAITSGAAAQGWTDYKSARPGEWRTFAGDDARTNQVALPLDMDGTTRFPAVRGRYEGGSKFVTWPKAGDVDGDGRVEIAVVAAGRLQVWDDDGSILWASDYLALDAVHGIYDVDGDGRADMITAANQDSGDAALHFMFRASDGTLLNTIKYSSCCIGDQDTLRNWWTDWDGDGKLELYMEQQRRMYEPALNGVFQGDATVGINVNVSSGYTGFFPVLGAVTDDPTSRYAVIPRSPRIDVLKFNDGAVTEAHRYNFHGNYVGILDGSLADFDPADEGAEFGHIGTDRRWGVWVGMSDFFRSGAWMPDGSDVIQWMHFYGMDFYQNEAAPYIPNHWTNNMAVFDVNQDGVQDIITTMLRNTDYEARFCRAYDTAYAPNTFGPESLPYRECTAADQARLDAENGGVNPNDDGVDYDRYTVIAFDGRTGQVIAAIKDALFQTFGDMDHDGTPEIVVESYTRRNERLGMVGYQVEGPCDPVTRPCAYNFTYDPSLYGSLSETSAAAHGAFLAPSLFTGAAAFTLTVDATSTGTGNEGMGIEFGHTDARNFYVFRWDTNSNVNNSRIYLQRYVNGVATNLGVTPPNSEQAEVGRTYEMKVVVSGGRIKAYVDNVLKLDVAAPAGLTLERYGVYSLDADHGVGYRRLRLSSGLGNAEHNFTEPSLDDLFAAGWTSVDHRANASGNEPAWTVERYPFDGQTTQIRGTWRFARRYYRAVPAGGSGSAVQARSIINRDDDFGQIWWDYRYKSPQDGREYWVQASGTTIRQLRIDAATNRVLINTVVPNTSCPSGLIDADWVDRVNTANGQGFRFILRGDACIQTWIWDPAGWTLETNIQDGINAEFPTNLNWTAQVHGAEIVSTPAMQQADRRMDVFFGNWRLRYGNTPGDPHAPTLVDSSTYEWSSNIYWIDPIPGQNPQEIYAWGSSYRNLLGPNGDAAATRTALWYGAPIDETIRRSGQQASPQVRGVWRDPNNPGQLRPQIVTFSTGGYDQLHSVILLDPNDPANRNWSWPDNERIGAPTSTARSDWEYYYSTPLAVDFLDADGDYGSDGVDEIIVQTNYPQRVLVYRQDGNGDFSRFACLGGGDWGPTLHLANMAGDATPEFILMNQYEAVRAVSLESIAAMIPDDRQRCDWNKVKYTFRDFGNRILYVDGRAFDDFDGDGYDEVVYVTREGEIQVGEISDPANFNFTGSQSAMNARMVSLDRKKLSFGRLADDLSLADTHIRALYGGDMDNDPATREIFAALDEGYAYGIRLNAAKRMERMWVFGIPASVGGFGALDLDFDNQLELIVAGLNGTVYSLDSSGAGLELDPSPPTKIFVPEITFSGRLIGPECLTFLVNNGNPREICKDGRNGENSFSVDYTFAAAGTNIFTFRYLDPETGVAQLVNVTVEYDVDVDDDQVEDGDDNCEIVFNPNQLDSDRDGLGDACDANDDNDALLDVDDNCPAVPNNDQADLDGDNIGDVCDDDVDGDGILNLVDNCLRQVNPNQANIDGDAFGDVCDDDIDGDGRLNGVDNCPNHANADQSDLDGDGRGEPCDDDDDGDLLVDTFDNCDVDANWAAPSAFAQRATATGFDLRGAAVSVHRSGRVYFFGSVSGTHRKAGFFDPAAGTWSALPDLPIGISGAQAAEDGDGRIHILGGTTFDAGDNPSLAGTHLIFNPTGNTYANGAALPASLRRAWSGGTLPVVAGVAYFVGGFDLSGEVVTATGSYDLVLDAFETGLPSMAPTSTAFDGSQAGVDQAGIIYLSNVAGQLHRYDAGRRQWLAPLQGLPALSGVKLAAGDNGKLLYMTGGGSNNLYLLDAVSAQALDTGVDWTRPTAAAGMLAAGTRLVAWEFSGGNTILHTATLGAGQVDLDLDGEGDLCDADRDGDVLVNGADNCPDIANSDQTDADGDGIGDLCDPDFALPALVDVTPDSVTFAQTAIDVTFTVVDDCPWAPQVEQPATAQRVSFTRSGERSRATYSVRFEDDGLRAVTVRARSRCDNNLVSGVVEIAIDRSNPTVTYTLAPSQAGVTPGQVETYPAILATALIDFNPVGLDLVSGLVSLEANIDGTLVIDQQTFPAANLPARGNSEQVRPTCGDHTDDPSLCESPNLLRAGALEPGGHCINVTADDAAGNSITRTWCFRVVEPSGLVELATDICAEYQTQVRLAYPNPNTVEHRIGEAGLAACWEGVACLDRAEPDIGCYVLGNDIAQKSLFNISRLLGQNPSPHAELRESLAQSALFAVRWFEQRIRAAIALPASAEKGRTHLLEGESALREGSVTAAMASALEGYFWYDDARRPFTQLSLPQLACAQLNTLIGEMDSYATAQPPRPGAADVDQVKALIQQASATMCDNNFDPNAACFDIKILSGIFQLMQDANTLLGFSGGGDDTLEGRYLVWSRNWRYGISRVSQFWINQSILNARGWFASDPSVWSEGCVNSLLAGEEKWSDVEALLDDFQVDSFLVEFTAPDAYCLMHDVFECVPDWWNDGQDAACAPYVPYTRPLECGAWPDHGGQVIGEN